MSLNGLRYGGQYTSPKPVPLWAKCFGWLVFLIALAGFLIGGWSMVLWRALTIPRPHRHTPGES
jgi:hypothetical protein